MVNNYLEEEHSKEVNLIRMYSLTVCYKLKLYNKRLSQMRQPFVIFIVWRLI